MLDFVDGVKIPVHIGDFGGDFTVADDAYGTLKYPSIETEKIISSDAFEKEFRLIVGKMLPSDWEVKQIHVHGRTIYAVPSYGAYYNMAGWLALAKVQGISAVRMGTYEDRLAIAVAKCCKDAGLQLSLTASREQAENADFLKVMEELEVKVDTRMCRDYFDFPYTYDEAVWGKPDYETIPASANYGAFPKPGLSGMFAGIYGTDLLKRLNSVPSMCVVPIDTGIEAVAVFKALSKKNCQLVTYEDRVAQEFHVVDTMCYTISVRRDDAKRDTVLCPECVDFWRKGKAARLGCDRLTDIPYQDFEQAGLSVTAAKAVALASEAFGNNKDILVLEVKA